MHDPQVLIQNFPIAMVLAPVADAYNGDPDTDVVSLKNAGGVNFILFEGAGGTGTVKIVAEACDDAAASNVQAINFKYAVAYNAGNLTDVFAAVNGKMGETTVASDGYTTTAGANKMVCIYIDARDLPEGKPYVRLNLTEVANSPCAASIAAILTRPGLVKFPMPTVLT